jgi:hypothetical protein
MSQPTATWLRSLRRQGITWQQFIFQFLIVAVGVWLAIVVGDYTTRNDHINNARQSLQAVLQELKQDEAEIIAVDSLRQQNDSTIMILAAEVSRPVVNDSAVEDLYYHRLKTNRTVFPRTAAYSMMTNGSQLQYITDPHLRLQLAELYDHDYLRLKTNSDISDLIWQNFHFAFADFWNAAAMRHIGTPADGGRLGSLISRSVAFSVYYQRLLKGDLKRVQDLEKAISDYAKD